MTQSDTYHESNVAHHGGENDGLDGYMRDTIARLQTDLQTPSDRQPFLRLLLELAASMRNGRRVVMEGHDAENWEYSARDSWQKRRLAHRLSRKEALAQRQVLLHQKIEDYHARNWEIVHEAFAQMPKPKAPRGPRLTTIRDQAKKIGAPAFAKDGITYFLDDPGRQATSNDTDAEWAAFEARHGKA